MSTDRKQYLLTEDQIDGIVERITDHLENTEDWQISDKEMDEVATYWVNILTCLDRTNEAVKLFKHARG